MKATNLKILDPELFTFDNYESCWWDNLDLECFHDWKDLVRELREHAVGICDGSRLSVRPNKNYYAVMCETDAGKFWFHVSKDMIDDCVENGYFSISDDV